MTNQTSSGKHVSDEEAFTARWDDISLSVNDYLEKIKCKSRQPEGVVESVLKMSYEELKRLAHEECGEYAFVLAQYGYFLQQELNYHNSKLTWCDNTLTYLTANYGPQNIRSNTFIKQAEKAALLCSTYKNMKSILDMQVNAKIIVDRLASLSRHIENMTKTLLNLQQSKRTLALGSK